MHWSEKKEFFKINSIQEYLQFEIAQNLAKTMNKLILLKLNAWYTLNVLETVEHY